MQSSSSFRIQFSRLLSQNQFAAFFWETPPVNQDVLNQEFRFVITRSTALETIRADKKPFAAHFQKAKSAISFYNLGKDAQLIVPCPVNEQADYAHIASFLRTADEKQIDEFWKLAADEYSHSVGEKPRWLSTAGLGVSWFHLRIDTRPKYYRHSPYKLL